MTEQPPQVWKGTGTALVVDDEAGVRLLTQRVLESMGFTVITAQDGLDGVEKFTANASEIRVILLDLTMPLMNGREVHMEVRKIRTDVPVLFTSGFTKQGEMQNIDHATDFLPKPFRVDELRNKLRALIERVDNNQNVAN